MVAHDTYDGEVYLKNGFWYYTTHHVTPYLENLIISSEYEGLNQLRVDDDNGFCLLNMFYFFLYRLHLENSLKNVFHVQSIISK